MNVLLSEFAELPFPNQGNIVYVLCFSKGECTDSIPFYVGESSRHIGRFGDYISAKFTAATDFKVGEAVKHLGELGYQVTVKYKESSNRKIDEKALIAAIRKKSFQLLNDLKGYNYKLAAEATQRDQIRRFIEEITGHSARARIGV